MTLAAKADIGPARRYMRPSSTKVSPTMTGSERSSADLDYRRRKVLYRSWHRGMREVDLILGSFADGEIAGLSEDELAIYEAFMAEADGDILKWVTGEQSVPARHDTPVFARILAYRSAAGA
jgi:antitoxin CptB